jgi:hypothetical protein
VVTSPLRTDGDGRRREVGDEPTFFVGAGRWWREV